MNWLASLGHYLGHGIVSFVMIFAGGSGNMSHEVVADSPVLPAVYTQSAGARTAVAATSSLSLLPRLSTSTGSTIATTSSSTDTTYLQKIITYNKHPDPTKTRVNNLSSINPLNQINIILKTISLARTINNQAKSAATVSKATSTQAASTNTKSTAKATAPTTKTTPAAISQPTSLGSALINSVANKIQTTIDQSVTPTQLPLFQDTPTKIKSALVNIYCTSKQGSTQKLITGSGVIINSRGIVLTDAHVAEYILVQKDYQSVNMQCYAKTGSPASIKYDVELVYISPAWVRNNSNNLRETAPLETGESDFALIKIIPLSGSNDIFKTSLHPLSLGDVRNSNPAYTGEKIIVGSYPADIISTQGISTALKNQTEYLSIQNSYNFSGAGVAGSQDIIETTPAVLGQRGSSGGAITDTDGNLLAIISIIVSSPSSNLYSIRGITIDHINASLQQDEGFTLDTLKDQDISQIQNNFMSNKAPTLEKLLTN